MRDDTGRTPWELSDILTKTLYTDMYRQLNKGSTFRALVRCGCDRNGAFIAGGRCRGLLCQAAIGHM
jgi:hypothetical protein